MYWNVSITYRPSLWLHFFSIWIFYKHLKESNHTPLIILIQFHHLWCLLHYETTPYLFPDHMSQPFLLYTNRQQDCTSSVFTKDRRTSRGFVCFFLKMFHFPTICHSFPFVHKLSAGLHFQWVYERRWHQLRLSYFGKSSFYSSIRFCNNSLLRRLWVLIFRKLFFVFLLRNYRCVDICVGLNVLGDTNCYLGPNRKALGPVHRESQDDQGSMWVRRNFCKLQTKK